MAGASRTQAGRQTGDLAGPSRQKRADIHLITCRTTENTIDRTIWQDVDKDTTHAIRLQPQLCPEAPSIVLDLRDPSSKENVLPPLPRRWQAETHVRCYDIASKNGKAYGGLRRTHGPLLSELSGLVKLTKALEASLKDSSSESFLNGGYLDRMVLIAPATQCMIDVDMTTQTLLKDHFIDPSTLTQSQLQTFQQKTLDTFSQNLATQHRNNTPQGA